MNPAEQLLEHMDSIEWIQGMAEGEGGNGACLWWGTLQITSVALQSKPGKLTTKEWTELLTKLRSEIIARHPELSNHGPFNAIWTFNDQIAETYEDVRLIIKEVATSW